MTTAGVGVPEARVALLIGSSRFDDEAFAQLHAPAGDVSALGDVLGDPAVGAFEVVSLQDRPAHEVARAVEAFTADRSRDDLLVMYFSGHGMKDERGRLYFVMADTERRLLKATAVAARFVSEALEGSRSRRNVLLLDCCYSGAFARGLTPKDDRSMHTGERFSGAGRVVITASDSVQYAFEGARVTAQDEMPTSVFTDVLVEGLRSGAADLDEDGEVTVAELYDYLDRRMAQLGVPQRPQKWEWEARGRIVVAGNPHARGIGAPLEAAVASPYPGVREAAVRDVARLLRSRNPAVVTAAHRSLRQLADDDSRRVAAAASAALGRASRSRTPTPARPDREPRVPSAERAERAVDGTTASLAAAGAAHQLVGRSAELRALHDLLATVGAGTASSLVVHGEAGAGKTVLLDWLVRVARGQDFLVLRATGVTFERTVPFSGLTSVLRPVAGIVDRLPAAQAGPLRVALGLEPGSVSELMVYVASLTVLSAAAETAPVLVVVDDAQWVDEASLGTLVFAAHRCDADPVGFVFAQRVGESSMLDPTAFPRMELGGLRPGDAVELLAGEGVRADVARRCCRLTDGNPLALIEGVRGLTPAQRSGDAPLPTVLPVGARLAAVYRARLADLPEATIRALGVAALESEGDLAVVASALAGLGGTPDDLAPAEARGVLSRSGGRVVWRHPLLRATADQILGDRLRREVHGALAEAAAASGAGDRAIWHLAESVPGPDDAVATRLADAAAAMLQRGARSEAAQAWDCAARLCASRADRSSYRLSAADARVGSGDQRLVVEDLRAEIESAEDPVVRARLAVLLGETEIWWAGSGPAVRRLEHHAAAVADADPTLSARLLLSTVPPRLLAIDVVGAADAARRAGTAAARGGDVGMQFATSANLTITELFSGAGRAAEIRLEPIGRISLAALDAGVEAADAIVALWAFAALTCEQWDAATAALRHVVAVSEAAGMAARGFLAQHFLADALWRTGRWPEAIAELTNGMSVQEATGLRYLLPLTLAILARFEAGLGRADSCRDHVASSVRAASERGLEMLRVWALSAAGLLALGAGRPAEAADAFDAVDRAAAHVPEPGWLWWQADAVEALGAAGRRRDADRVLDRLASQSAATGRQWAAAAVERCRGLHRHGDPEQHFAAALTGFQRVGATFEEARTLLLRGEHRIAEGDRAGGSADLAAARTMFDAMGARDWGERAARQRGEAGSPDRSLASVLTPAELRVAVTVGRGVTNREAADELFLSVKTVDYHLQSIYRKLGLRSRAQLAALVARKEPGAP